MSKGKTIRNIEFFNWANDLWYKLYRLVDEILVINNCVFSY